ncbi:hypothetical protein K7X08_022908 [Anisodus acutangulus]|uniref:Pentatricopeptide repeat-containing protein n=1 Tax=Anisodus acutangulus TaxID=402998 RepID=A0A9Q1MD97_9SOLA|nr:hypothetical protein K7X08_022908 [Anisodus acutangulus]
MVNCKNYDDALFLMKELMIRRGYSPLEILEVLLDTFASRFTCDAVFDTLVRACTELGASEGAYSVIEKLRTEGLFVSIHAWNNFLNHIVKVDDDVCCRFWFFYKEMVSYGYSENVYTFNLIIYALCKECKLLEAICVFYKMLKSWIVPNVVTFNMLVDGACRISEMDVALKLVRNVRIMSGGFVVPNIVTYNCLINGYCKLGDVEIGERFLDEMIETGLEPNVRTYATLVDGYPRKGMLDEAFRVCDAMVEKGLMPNSVVYNTVIHRLYVEGDVDGASSLLSDMIEKYISPDKFTHSIHEKGLCRNGHINEALSYHKCIVEKNLTEDAFSHNILIDYLCKSRNILAAQQLVCSMFVRGLIPDIVTYGTMIDGYCKEGNINRAVEVYDDIIKMKKNPNLVVYNSILDGLCKEVSVDVAEVLVEELKGTSLYDVITHNTLLNGYCISGKIDKALDLFLKMRKERISVNEVTLHLNLFYGSATSIRSQTNGMIVSAEVFNCPNLKEISLDFSRQENDSTGLTAMMDGIGRSCPRLQNIHVASVRLTNAVVLALTAENLSFGIKKAFPCIRSEITDASIVAIASSYSRLELLDLSG